MGTRLSSGNPTTLERTLRLLLKNPFVQALQGLPEHGREFFVAIINAAREQKAQSGDSNSKAYRTAHEADVLAQMSCRYWTDCYLQMLAMTPSDHPHSTDAEPKTVLGEGGLAVIIAGDSPDARVLMHSGPHGIRTQYDSGGY